MFDLENEIRAWRESAGALFQRREEILDELEDHLRDHFAALIAESVEPREAWVRALAELGDPKRLASEFMRGASQMWMPVRVARIAFAILQLFLIALLPRRWEALLSWHVLLVTMGYTAGLAAGLLAAWSTLAGMVSNWDARKHRSLQAGVKWLALVSVVGTTAGIVLGALWSRLHWGQYWNWDAREVGGLAVLSWGIVCFLACVGPRIRWAALLIPLAANIVVALAWFGAALWDRSGLHASGYPAAAQDLLIGWVVLHVLIGGVALIPRWWPLAG